MKDSTASPSPFVRAIRTSVSLGPEEKAEASICRDENMETHPVEAEGDDSVSLFTE